MKTKKELQQILSNMEAMVDSYPFEAWLKDAEGNYIIVNKKFEDYAGKKKDELIGKRDCDIFPKKEADIYMASDQAAIKGALQSYYEAEYRPGKYKREYISPVFDRTGTLIGTAGFSYDVTEQRRINEAHIESERSKAILLSNLPGMAYRSHFDEELSMSYLSEGCYDLTGYKPEELLGKNPSFYDLILPEYREPLLKKWREQNIYNTITPDEYQIRTASGEIKWVWEQYQDFFDPDKLVSFTEGLIIDITERKLAEKALQESEERFRTMFEEAPLGMGIFDSVSGKGYQVNDRLAEIAGRTKAEILSLTWRDYTHPDDIEENLHKINLLNTGMISGFSMNKRFIKPDGTIIWVNVTVTPFQHGDGHSRRLLGMVEDITERKLADEEILYLSYYDQLTGLYNRRYYEEALHRLDTGGNLPITLVMADINGLKLINDAFGHLEGDRLLKEFASIIKKELRPEYIAARTGGDEFIILMPETGLNDAEKLVERIKGALLDKRINNIIYSASFGFSTKEQSTQSLGEVYMNAEDQMYRHKLSESTSMRNETIKVITKTLFEKNKREQLHCERVSEICESIGIALNMNYEDINELKTAGLLHDIGKIGITESILNKKGKLTETEWSELKRHPEIGYQILRSVNEFALIAEYVLYHHERIDGTGYPSGLEGKEIPLQSKIISIADAFDAMTHERSYKDKLSRPEAFEELLAHSGTQFDAEICRIFIDEVGALK